MRKITSEWAPGKIRHGALLQESAGGIFVLKGAGIISK
jgi:hypothetical protein